MDNFLLTDEEIEEASGLFWQIVKGYNNHDELRDIAKAQINKLIQWLYDPCTEHDKYYDGTTNIPEHYYCQHRKDCGKCMEELEKWSTK
jgi:hypothetical protein